jgi:nitroreductase
MMVESMDALEALVTRHSVAALKLREPGPSAQQLTSAIDAALRAPDHGNLKPWRGVLIRGDARQRLSDLFVRRMQQRTPPAPAGKLEKARTMPLSAPLIIAVGAHIHADHKVPEVEQLLSVGAATMNLMNALHAQGYASIWLTGPNAYDPDIALALHLSADERLLGFVYVGTSVTESAQAPSTDHTGFVHDWNG